MNHQTRLAVYQAQVENVRFLETACKQLLKAINLALRTNNMHMADVQTKVYAQTFCSWSEASFLKLIHTPYGFSNSEVIDIKDQWNRGGITEGWRKAVKIAMRRVPASRSNFKPNAIKKLDNTIDLYIKDPSLIRNKIAHGQWKVALNRTNTAVNHQTTSDLASIDVVKVDSWIACQRHLYGIIESLIISPERTFLRDYWSKIEALEATMRSYHGKTLQAKIALLRKKPVKRPK